MSLEKMISSLPSSLSLRLALWYTAIYTLSSAAAFMVVYFILESVLLNQMDSDLIEDIEELSVIYQEEGLQSLRNEIRQEELSEGADKVLYSFYDSFAERVLGTDTTDWQELTVRDDLLEIYAGNGDPVLDSASLDSHEHDTRIVYGLIGTDEGKGKLILQIAQSLEENDEQLEVLRNIFALTVPALLLIAFPLGLFVAKKAMGGVEEVTETAIRISNGSLNERVPASNRGLEIDRLSSTFNNMLDKIQLLISGMRDLNDNIAHDLKSPLARIRGIAESTLTGDQDKEQYRHFAASTIEECDQLLHLINTMLDIAETEAGLTPIMESLDLSALLKDANDLYQPLAADNDITLSYLGEENIPVRGNRQFLQRLVGNLLDNAIKYTQRGGRVTISQIRTARDVKVQITDTGFGIEAKDLANIFKRFYRCDLSRTKPGSGLGLCLAQAIAQAHWGNITVASTPKEGSVFTITLPLLAG